MDYFLEIFGTLPRAGPGSDELTRKALGMIPDLPESPRILDVGCGPGAQTIELLQNTKADVVALDLSPEMIERVVHCARHAGVSSRLETVVQDMGEMTFPASSFDLIWSEGAIYNLGFERGLRSFRELVKPGGFVAVSDAVWLKPDPPSEVVDFWREYPEIDFVQAKKDIIQRIGYKLIRHFVFPADAWTEQYYNPMEERIAQKAEAWAGIPEAEAVLDEARNEISLFRKFSAYYSYAFFIMQR